MADDPQIHQRIEELVAEEHRLLETAGERALDDGERSRLSAVNVELDRYYDLLRQRRARQEFGQDTGAAALRAGETVETYLQ
ncbi:MAG: DUF2630 family protein [Vulcanimicrobiaceae bacterium]